MAAFSSENKMAAFAKMAVYGILVTIFQKESFEPDLNQRPMDFWQRTTTVHRSTNWAIEGSLVRDELLKVTVISMKTTWNLVLYIPKPKFMKTTF